MSDREHERLQGCIDELESVQNLFRERLAILESIVVGNGRPGIMKLIESATVGLEGINERLTKVEHQNKYVKMRNADIWTNIRNIIFVLGFVASMGFNVYFALTR